MSDEMLFIKWFGISIMVCFAIAVIGILAYEVIQKGCGV